MSRREIIERLDQHHLSIRAGIEEIRRQCAAGTPDSIGLGSARLKLSRASMARTKFINESVLPLLAWKSDQILHDELRTLSRYVSGKRLASSEHVVTWTSVAIERDWSGYQAAARRIMVMMDEQVSMERSILLPRLRAIQEIQL